MKAPFLISVTFVLFFSCKKELPLTIEEPIDVENWEKFIGHYNVYDTLEEFLYEMDISHFFSGKNIYNIDVDSLPISQILLI